MDLSIYFLIISATIGVVTSKTHVTVYEHSNYGGGSVYLPDLEDYSHYYFTSFNDKTSSYKINSGSCVILCEHDPPGGTCVYSTTDMPSTTLNDQVSSVMMCPVSTRSAYCPSGTFVKSIEWDNSQRLKRGIKIGCYEPSSKTPTSIVYTHPGQSFTGSKQECTGLRGIEYVRQTSRETYVDLLPICVPGQNSGPHKFVCSGKTEAIYGVSVLQEVNSDEMKDYQASVRCSDVGDIEEICRAHDEKQMLFTCDATGAVAPLKCTYQKKVGFGQTTTMSEEQRNEYTFYSEFGFEMGAAGFGLSANFKATVGNSNTTGYSWANSTGSTWTEEITVTVEIEAPPRCKTVVTEVVGHCSFLAVRPYYFERNDTCSGKSLVSYVQIPEDIGGKVFVSPAPTEASGSLPSSGFVGVPNRVGSKVPNGVIKLDRVL